MKILQFVRIQNRICTLEGHFDGISIYISECMAYLYLVNKSGFVKCKIEADCGQNFGFIDKVEIINNVKIDNHA